MIICFPADSDLKGESVIYEHFAAAPVFVIYNTETEEYKSVVNHNDALSEGSRNVSLLISAQGAEVVIATGMGDGAIKRLNSLGIKVYWAKSGMVEYDIKLFESEKLPEAVSGNCDGSLRE